jgi:hypothetical protein
LEFIADSWGHEAPYEKLFAIALLKRTDRHLA